jgi:hypothetical protein
VSGDEVAKITGSREQVAKAKAMILKIMLEENTPAYAKLAKGQVKTPPAPYLIRAKRQRTLDRLGCLGLRRH